MQSREIRLASRPHGEPTLDHFRFATIELIGPADGEVLVRNIFISVDPYMRGRMNAGASYVPPFDIDRALEGGAIGRVVLSRDRRFPEGSLVMSQFGWREAFVASADKLQPIDPRITPVSSFLGALGITGLTAWGGLFKIAALQPGETLFVSGGAGAVGSVACQLAKLHGCRVIASAGSAEKVAFLRDELKVDYAFRYHDDPLAHLRNAAPEGIHVYFDNTGGPQLEAALSTLKMYGRVALCGAIAGYNTPVAGPRNLPSAIGKRLILQGFIVIDFLKYMPEFLAEALPAFHAGKLLHRETVLQGLDAAPAAFLALLRSGDSHIGKLVIQVGE